MGQLYYPLQTKIFSSVIITLLRVIRCIRNDRPPSGQTINSVSCQINKTNMVYTYVVEEYSEQTQGWVFSKRIIGIINIADNALPVGFKQEFEVNEDNAAQFFPGNSNYKALAAIGVHKPK